MEMKSILYALCLHVVNRVYQVVVKSDEAPGDRWTTNNGKPRMSLEQILCNVPGSNIKESFTEEDLMVIRILETHEAVYSQNSSWVKTSNS